jgi:phosphatidylinositol glycan class Q protein
MPSLLYAIGILSCFGMTMAISLFSDMLCLFTAHIYACYLVSTAVYHHQLKTAGSLWNLFRGTYLVHVA